MHLLVRDSELQLLANEWKVVSVDVVSEDLILVQDRFQPFEQLIGLSLPHRLVTAGQLASPRHHHYSIN